MLSGNELRYFYNLDFADNVIDIREQFPLLPIETTEQIAEEIGVKHPTDPNTGEHTVLTTDFLITKIQNGRQIVIARTIKEIDDLNNKRQMEKFEIERRYWRQINESIDWGIVTEQNISKAISYNIEIIHPFYSLDNLVGFENISQIQLKKLIGEFGKAIIGDDVIVREVADIFDNKMVLMPGTGIMIFKHLVVTKQIIINMAQPINIDLPQIILPSNRN